MAHLTPSSRWRSTAGRGLAAAAILFLAIAAAPEPQWGPNGNGTLDHSDDRRWAAFHDADIVADQAKGEYVAKFGSTLRHLDGQVTQITGYMLPVEPSTHAAHFILTRRSTGCPFCPPNEPTEAIEVRTAVAIDYTQEPVTVRGKLHLVTRSDTGLFYRMDEANRL